jgi:hypothetical protein
MDTTNLKPFATNMRTLLMNGVEQQMRYWGFADGPEPSEAVEEVEGGYLFRGEVHRGERVPGKWKALKKAVQNHSVKDVVEAAASTWFNRLMAIRILEKNNHDRTILGYAPDTSQPQILYNAAQGILPYGTDGQKQSIQKSIQEGDDDAALRTLLTAYANDHDLLKDVFGRVEDYTELLLPARLTNDGGIIDTLVTTDAITDDDYEQVELIGWLYQFYISEKKDEVYGQSGKFRPEDIPAATQIFTPDWIVKYMVENTVGKLWLEGHPDSPLRRAMEYLVEGEGEREKGGEGEREQGEMFDDAESEAGGDGEPLVTEPRDLQLFDPAAGSGHILVEGFDLLVQIYTEAGYTTREAVEFILTENLLGLDIDRRAAELARFALLMKAAQHDKRVLKRRGLRPQVYAMPEPRTFSSADLRAYLGDEAMDQHGEAIREALEQMRKHGQNVGSALKLSLSDEARAAIRDAVSDWRGRVENDEVNFVERQLHDELVQYLQPALLLTGQYPAVALNPPYMGLRKMNEQMKSYAENVYPDSKYDLCTVMTEKAWGLSCRLGLSAVICKDSIMFNSSFQRAREQVLATSQILSLLHLGAGAFEELSGEVVQATSFIRRRESEKLAESIFHDLRSGTSSSEKESMFRSSDNVNAADQADFLKIPGSPMAYWASAAVIQHFADCKPLSDYADARQGMATSNNDRFLRMWQEISWDNTNTSLTEYTPSTTEKWIPYNKGGGFRKWFGNNTFVINWAQNGQEVKQFAREKYGSETRTIKNQSYYFKEVLEWSDIGSRPLGARWNSSGHIFDAVSMSAFPNDKELTSAILGYLNASVSDKFIQCLAPGMHYSTGYVSDVPFILPGPDASKRISAISKECLETSIRHWDASEASWDFAQHPLVQQDAVSAESAYESWREGAVDDFLQLHSNEEELNEIFIDLYGLEDELDPDVAFGDITILEDEIDQDALDELNKRRGEMTDAEVREALAETFKIEVPVHQFLSYGIGVMLGRYRLGKDGLHIAHPDPSRDELAPYTVETPDGEATFEIDDDAILPVMGQDSPFSDDAVYRMRQILEMVWGKDQLTESVNFVNRALSVGRSRGLKRNYTKTMEEWLVNDFWDYHKKLYSVPYYGKKPIYWLFQSPEKHFQALVYMHRMDKYTVQQVRQQYLHVFQNYLRSEIAPLEAKSDSERTNDEQKRLETLRAKADDARAYDAILKDIADQQIEIDLDDGVQENYPKFGEVVASL